MKEQMLIITFAFASSHACEKWAKDEGNSYSIYLVSHVNRIAAGLT